MFVLSEKAYEFGKKLVQVILPAISSLYFGLASIWEFPEPEKVVGTLAILTTFLGVCLGISTSAYRKLNDAFGGKIVVSENDEGIKLFSLELESDPEILELKNSVTFKIEKQT